MYLGNLDTWAEGREGEKTLQDSCFEHFTSARKHVILLALGDHLLHKHRNDEFSNDSENFSVLLVSSNNDHLWFLQKLVSKLWSHVPLFCVSWSEMKVVISYSHAQWTSNLQLAPARWLGWSMRTRPIRRHVVQYKLVFILCPLLRCLYFYITRVSVLHTAQSFLLSVKVPSRLSIQFLELL